LTDSMTYTFKIHPVESAMKSKEFYQFIRRMTNHYGGYRITHCYTIKDGNVLIEFGSHFDPLKLGKAKGFKGPMEAILRRICPDREMKTILIENDQLLLDQAILMNILSTNRKLMIELPKPSVVQQLAANCVIPLYEGIFIDAQRRLVVDLEDSWKVAIEDNKIRVDLTSEKEKRSQLARDIVHVRHGLAGEICCKLDKVCQRWLTAEYHSRDLCADVNCRSLGISFAAAREVLRDMPEPCL